MKILCVVGTRPNFVKMAALYEEFRHRKNIELTLVHTGQHYDDNMSRLLFQDLGLPEPDFNLGVSGGSHTIQTARVMLALERLLHEQRPELALLFGDVNATLSSALVAAKERIPVAHVESGLRSGDREMPEELNRIVVDHLSDFLFVTEQSGVINLRREGIDESRIFLVGNVMVDTLDRFASRAELSGVLGRLGVKPNEYVLATIHRPSNTDDQYRLSEILGVLNDIGQEKPVVFPIHPRTASRFAALRERCQHSKSTVRMVEPMGYLDFLWAMKNAYAVITDSGGIQEETTILGVPCLTARENTERPVTIDEGTNHLVGVRAESILNSFHRIDGSRTHSSRRPPFWDGKAAGRIVDVLVDRLA